MESTEQGWIYLKGLQTLSQICLESLWQSLLATPSGEAETSAEYIAYPAILQDLQRLFSLSLKHFLGHDPSNLGSTSDHDFAHQLLKTWEAWIKFQQASFQYQGVQGAVWVQTFDQLIQVLASPTSPEVKIQTWQQLLRVWSRLFDQVFAQIFRTPEALNIQRKSLNSALQFRLQQQKLAEIILKFYDLPTRNEIDDIHRSIYELRKAIKTLQ
ncbi:MULTISPECIES: poly(R)-hydroxyalkanoic acid synthase subunit PhaE [Cyanophyceae]|uniref:poly(R)-hydroxyalkanoic acid synthase subunit PhaE n=1 Tax=Cyanophyceae TaxID=3028117 RepID=UPI00168605A8|nr:MULTISPECIES: poly(R)-hydroxyalkanoic acid synthase subunit PhaE [Cyanophyceae]MBD1914675.1 hypothetical protein [Phormidium sp. FACHB-77]MBD2032563.1 hypothetical protein [Phormidium sp. FACHB-322]MBD2049421.1 hypothetical protein [Leptolyngbya sp. FACHB-60]